MLIATVPYVGKRLHLDPDPNPDPKLNYGSGCNMQIISDPAGSGSTTLVIGMYGMYSNMVVVCRGTGGGG